ncbi:lipopolysaccharide biosynthesis protein [Dorea phocaeensis]|uniref:lipopolysaccharide biosynthesis protein n=2 Tax=Dorea phocaeensis TaxID=2040291 RepID=UPI00156E671D|nr:lipopolysaccharide biosynthesis protein [Dorea phocaeensis]
MMKKVNERPSERSIYIWNITGSIANALLSVVALMIVTRILDDRQADIFSIAWTISQLMATVGTFQIRMYQATDVTGVFRFRQYLIYRMITIGIMMISSYAYVMIRGYSGEKAVVVLLMCIFRAVDSLADVYEGWFQQKERLDLSGKALTYRIVVAVLGFGVVLFTTRNLILSGAVLVVVYVVCFFVYDIRYHYGVEAFRETAKKDKAGLSWVVKMTIEGFPLFINAFLMMSIMNAPKMVLDVAIEQGSLAQGLQTVFNIIFMPASFLNLAYIVFRPLITKMAIVWNIGKAKEFLKILMKIMISLFGIGILLLIGSALLGIPILSIVYAVDLKDYKMELLIIIVGGCMYTFAAVLDNALVVIRKQYILILAYVFTYIYIKFAAEMMTGRWGILGASLSYASAMAVFLIITAVMFAFHFYKASKKLKVLGEEESGKAL